MQTKYYGIDVSKDTLDIAYDSKSSKTCKTIVIGNNLKEIKAFVRTLPAHSYVAMEATNTYHLMLADQCFAAGMLVYVVNPRITRHYREVHSLRGHNDRMDAKTISSFIETEHEHLRSYIPKSQDQRKLQTLVRRRTKLISVQGTLNQSMSDIKELKRELKSAQDRIGNIVKKIDLLIDKMLDGNEDRDRLLTIPGIGAVISAGLLPDLQAGNFHNADALVAFYGLDPRPNDSGKCKGKRKISKQGSRHGRTLFFNSAMSATRSKAWQPIYQSYLDRGLSKIQAIVALARRIARTVWSVYTHKTTFDPARITKSSVLIAA